MSLRSTEIVNLYARIKALEDVLRATHPAKVWDLARDYYTTDREFFNTDGITQHHKKQCSMVDEILVKPVDSVFGPP